MTVSRVPNVEGGIQPTIVTAKGDLITAVANANPARLGVGSDGQLLTADSTAATGLSYQNNFAAGKNKIINGDFGVWQRGTSFSMASTVYTADRWVDVAATAFPTGTVSRQTFTPGTAPAAGYESSFFARLNITAANSCTNLDYDQKIEDVRTFAGQTVTVSFWAKADAASTMGVYFEQNFGSGGSASVYTSVTSINLTTAWVRYSTTFTLGSLTGKTIGTSSFLMLGLRMPTSAGVVRVGTYDYWGVQVESGSTATAFQTATGTIQGELAACQRYYQRYTSDGGPYGMMATGKGFNVNTIQVIIPLKTTMRVSPSALDTSAASTFIANTGGTDVTSLTSIALNSNLCSTQYLGFDVTKNSSFTVGAFYFLYANNSTSSYVGASAEL